MNGLMHNVHLERYAFIWGLYVLGCFWFYYFLRSWLVADAGSI